MPPGLACSVHPRRCPATRSNPTVLLPLPPAAALLYCVGATTAAVVGTVAGSIAAGWGLPEAATQPTPTITLISIQSRLRPFSLSTLTQTGPPRALLPHLPLPPPESPASRTSRPAYPAAPNISQPELIDIVSRHYV